MARLALKLAMSGLPIGTKTAEMKSETTKSLRAQRSSLINEIATWREAHHSRRRQRRRFETAMFKTTKKVRDAIFLPIGPAWLGWP